MDQIVHPAFRSKYSYPQVRLGTWVKLFSVTVVFWMAAFAANAQPKLESMQLAQSLGDLLASETFCGLHYSQPAIEAFIAKRVRPDDLDFNSMLTVMTSGTAIQLEELSLSGKTAHCAQTARVAKNYGFTP